MLIASRKANMFELDGVNLVGATKTQILVLLEEFVLLVRGGVRLQGTTFKVTTQRLLQLKILCSNIQRLIVLGLMTKRLTQ